ncbi:MAG: ABC transporter ATP-binding protein [Ignavibacteriae bacterium]|nr:ABC transporter ATP-binding protein [Ignavibacteria bacterium]MBI3364073.1 ABC transporter ATP-binding protein [Ignavibacteriota bacterium]
MKNFSTYLRIVRFARSYWKHISTSVLCTIFYSIFSGVSIYLFIPLLDILFHPERMRATQAATESLKVPFPISSVVGNMKQWFIESVFQGTQIDALFRICIILIVAFVLKNFFGYLQSFLMNYAEEGVIRDLRNALYRHLHDLPLGYFTNERTGELISRVTNDVTVINGGISALFVTLIREPLLIIVFLGLAISISWKLTLISFLVFPFALFIISLIAIRLHKERGISQERLADITSVLQETISGVKVVKAFGMENFENEKFSKQTNRYFRSLITITRIRDLASPMTEILSVIAGAIIIWFGGKQILIEHNLNASEFLSFLFIIFQVMPPIKELTNVNNRIQEASAAGKRIFEILDTKPSITSRSDATVLQDFRSSIEFRNVNFSYDIKTNGQDGVLRNINMNVKKGEVVAIVGPSGSGKTTLVDLVPRFYDPSSGGIFIDGNDLRDVDVQSLREKIGVVTQETILFNDTVRNNIAYGLDDCPLEKIIEAAKAANAHNFIVEMPGSYDNIIGERGVKLSGGERQRLSLARAILKNPPILILDEATSALDTESEILVQEAIDHLMAGRTSIVIAHRLSTVQHADRIVVLNDGQIVEVGKHAELIANPNGLYRKLYELQFRV